MTLAPDRPEPDEDSAFYWDGLRRHRLVVQRCPACRAHRFPPMPSCPVCGAEGGDRVAASGLGQVYSWVRVHHAFNDAYASDVPYTIAVVELEEGCRLLGRVERSGPPSPGDRVRAVFFDHDDWTELRWRPVSEGGW